MTTHIFSSSDAGAISSGLYLTTAPGSLVTILDACLLNGYPGKSSAGWSKPYTGTNQGVYQTPQGNQRFLMVDDTTSRYTTVTGYETMSGINAGTGPFPNVIGSGQAQTRIIKTNNSSLTTAPVAIIQVIPGTKQFKFSGNVTTILNMPANEKFVVTGNSDSSTNGVYTVFTAAAYTAGTDTTLITVSEVISPTAANNGIVLASYRPNWLLFATEKAFIFWSNWEYTFTPNYPYMNSNSYFFGDFISHRAGDQFNTILIAQTAVTSDVLNNMHTCDSSLGSYTARPFTQMGSSTPAMRTPHSGVKFSTISGSSSVAGVPFPNPIDGGIVVSQLWVTDGAGVSPYTIRGILPGVWWSAHQAAFSHGQIINGSGALAGKTFMAILTWHSSSVCGQMLIETSNTW